MKTSFLALLVALSASSVLASPASPVAPSSAPFGYSVSEITQPNNANITRGTSLATVRQMMGAPLRQLDRNVWVYSGYHPDVSAEQKHGCNTLLITFTDGLVSDLKIVNKQATDYLAANLKVRTATVRIAKN